MTPKSRPIKRLVEHETGKINNALRYLIEITYFWCMISSAAAKLIQGIVLISYPGWELMAVCLHKSLEAGSRRCLLAELTLVSCFPQIQSAREQETNLVGSSVLIQLWSDMYVYLHYACNAKLLHLN